MRTRLDPKLRKITILEMAIELSMILGYQNIKRTDLAKQLKCVPGLITHHYAMDDLKNEVMRAAIARGIPEIIAQGIGTRHPLALKIPTELKKKAIAFLAK